MKARQLIDGCSFGPEALKAIGQAFDTAWQEIAGNFGSAAAEVEAARLQLASALLSIGNEDSRNAEVLKRAALDGARLQGPVSCPVSQISSRLPGVVIPSDLRRDPCPL